MSEILSWTNFQIELDKLLISLYHNWLIQTFDGIISHSSLVDHQIFDLRSDQDHGGKSDLRSDQIMI